MKKKESHEKMHEKQRENKQKEDSDFRSDRHCRLHREPDLLCVTCRPNYEGFAIWLGHPIRVVQTQEHTYWAIRASGLDI